MVGDFDPIHCSSGRKNILGIPVYFVATLLICGHDTDKIVTCERHSIERETKTGEKKMQLNSTSLLKAPARIAKIVSSQYGKHLGSEYANESDAEAVAAKKQKDFPHLSVSIEFVDRPEGEIPEAIDMDTFDGYVAGVSREWNNWLIAVMSKKEVA